MSHIGASAYNLATGQVFATKKALREAVAATPDKVLLTTTSALETARQITADRIVPGETWNVVGPTPLTRKWYANINAKGNPSKPVVT